MIPLPTNWPPTLQQITVRYLLHSLGNTTASLAGLAQLADLEAESRAQFRDWIPVVDELKQVLSQFRMVVQPGALSKNVCELSALGPIAERVFARQTGWTLSQALNANGTVPLPAEEIGFLFQQTMQDTDSRTGSLILETEPFAETNRVRSLVPGEFASVLKLEWSYPIPSRTRSDRPAPQVSLLVWHALAHAAFGTFENEEREAQKQCRVYLPVRPLSD